MNDNFDATNPDTGEVIPLNLDIEAIAAAVKELNAPKRPKRGPKPEKSRGFVMMWNSLFDLDLTPNETLALMSVSRTMDHDGHVRFQLAEIAELCQVTGQSAWRIVKGLTVKDGLRRVGKGHYIVNPYVVWCGHLAERATAKLRWDGHIGGTGVDVVEHG